MQLKKPHACGKDMFAVVRTGADYKLKCLNCGHVVLLDKISAERAIKKLVHETMPEPVQEINDRKRTTKAEKL